MHDEIPVYAIKGEDNETYYKHIKAALDHKPHLTMDDGADLVSTIHKSRTELLKDIVVGTEETTTGVIRLKAMAKDGMLKFPIMAVNDAMTKHFLTIVMARVNPHSMALCARRTFCSLEKRLWCAGYGWCGKDYGETRACAWARM